jgi:hypothetical protein
VGFRNNNKLLVSHLLFANDTLIFCEANPKHLCHLCCIFLGFEAISGLKINFVKSELVSVGTIDDFGGLASILGSRVSSLPVKYLVLPLGDWFKVKSS